MSELKVKNESGQWIPVRGNAGPRGPGPTTETVAAAVLFGGAQEA